MKKNLHLLLLLLVGIGFAACSDDETPLLPPDVSPGKAGAYVIAQGNQFAGVAGALDALTFTATDSRVTVTDDAFRAVNGVSLGDGPQDAVVYGSKLYVPMFDSNLLWVLDKDSLNIIAQVVTNAPEGVCAAAGRVFVANNDGYVSAIDTVSFSVASRTAVGPNPDKLVAVNDLVYVTISDGYNGAGGYANGKRVAVLSAATGDKLRDIAVGLNPGKICADIVGNLFVVCRGDYAAVPAKVMKIAAGSATATDVAQGSLIAVNGTTLYVLDATTDWQTGTTTVASATYNTLTGNLVKADFLPAGSLPPAPQGVNVNPATGDLYVSSDPSAFDYDKRGYVFRYTKEGSFIDRLEVGIHPIGVVFR